MARAVRLAGRACALHAAYLEELAGRADHVPAPGEVVPLVEVGTHARGAIFLDGEHLVTPELEAAVASEAHCCPEQAVGPLVRSEQGVLVGLEVQLRLPAARHPTDHYHGHEAHTMWSARTWIVAQSLEEVWPGHRRLGAPI